MDRKLLGFVTGVGLAFVAGAASAAPLSIISGAGLENSCTLGAGLGASAGDPCVTQNITPHPAWNPAPPAPPGYGGAWVSYANTGYQQGTLAPPRGSSTNPFGTSVIFTITETFSGAGFLDFWVWADDTVNLYLDDLVTPVKAANFTDNTCAQGPVGCQPGEHFQILQAVGAGDHTIKIEVFQYGTINNTTDNPFGLLYSGQFTPNAVPEPATLALLGAGLLGLGMYRRRRAH